MTATKPESEALRTAPTAARESEEREGESGEQKRHLPPPAAERELSLTFRGVEYRYAARAEWTLLRQREAPAAEIFTVSFSRLPLDPKRPITFVFNGGPGASSAYLHLGALGPRGVTFGEQGEAPPHASLADNPDTWLPFSDLVFIDPIGSGLSRAVAEVRHERMPPEDQTKLTEAAKTSAEFYTINKDLEGICELIQRHLSKHHRWQSPVYLCGESYGGYRVGRLVRRLPEEYGVGVHGAILVSPAIEPNSLDGSDYDVVPWIERFPTMALAAHYHRRSGLPRSLTPDQVAERAVSFATDELARLLIRGTHLTSTEQRRIIGESARMIGVSADFMAARNGRVDIVDYAKELLRDEQQVVGLYDATQLVFNPFPDRSGLQSPDPNLHQAERIFAPGIHHLLWHELGIQTERRYHLLSHEAFAQWRNDVTDHVFNTQFGATDDIRFGMSLNPHMRVWVIHGLYDLVTPFFASERLSYHLKLSPQLLRNLTFSRYRGGHMFYTWPASRQLFADDARRFYQLGSLPKRPVSRTLKTKSAP